MSTEILANDYRRPATAIPVEQIDFLPNVVLVEYVDCYQLIANLRGVAEDGVTVGLRDYVLSIAGDCASDLVEDDGCHQLGAFRYNIGLPDDTDAEDISCAFGDDEVILTIGRRHAA